MQGLNSLAAVYRRTAGAGTSGMETTSSGNWRCQIDPVTSEPELAPFLLSSTHRALGLLTPEIVKGYKLRIDGESYNVLEKYVRKFRGLPHHQEVYLIREE